MAKGKKGNSGDKTDLRIVKIPEKESIVNEMLEKLQELMIVQNLAEVGINTKYGYMSAKSHNKDADENEQARFELYLVRHLDQPKPGENNDT
jgi:hypothetical protein